MPNTSSKSEHVWIGCLVMGLLAAFVRGLAMEYLPDSLIHSPKTDTDAYVLIAHQLRTNGEYGREPGIPTAYRPPGYTLSIAPWCRTDPPQVMGIASLHLLCAALTAGITVLWASSFGMGKGSWLAGLLVALDPILIRQSTLIMSETLFTTLFIAAIFSLSKGSVSDSSRWWLALAGCLWGFATMTRPIAGIVFLLLGIVALKGGWVKKWLLTSLVAGVTLLPWAIRNQLVMGKPILTTTHGGYTLWLGQNPTYFKEVVRGQNGIWPEESFQQWTKANSQRTSGLSEIEQDAIYHQEAWEWMSKNPNDALKSAIYHVRSFWDLTPKAKAISGHVTTLISIYYSVLFVTALFAGLRWLYPLLHWPGCIILIAMLAFTLVHTLYWSDMRMRAPLAPLMATLIAGGVTTSFRKRIGKTPVDQTRTNSEPE